MAWDGDGLSDLTVLVVWPMVALVLVLFGATFASSGHPTRSAVTVRGVPKVMVVIAPDDGGVTVVRAIDAARRRGAEITFVGDPTAIAAAYDRMGRLESDRSPAMKRVG